MPGNSFFALRPLRLGVSVIETSRRAAKLAKGLEHELISKLPAPPITDHRLLVTQFTKNAFVDLSDLVRVGFVARNQFFPGCKPHQLSQFLVLFRILR